MTRGTRTGGRRWPTSVAAVLIVAALAAACGSSSNSGSGSSTTKPPATAAAEPKSKTLGIGVTPTTVKVGVALVDFDCIKQFTDTIRPNQTQVYGAFIKNINEHGGIAGRTIVPVYASYCPIGSAGPLQVCTKLTEDDKVFAVLGTFIDFSGDAQQCVAKQHKRVLVTFNLTQAIINKAPPGLIVLPGSTNERVVKVLLQLVGKEKTLEGKKVAVVGGTTEANTVKNVIVPGLKKIGVSTATPAILSVGGADTTAAQSQLDSFIERWKSEGANAVFISGIEVGSKQFVEKIRKQIPNVMLLIDTTDALDQAKQEQTAGVKPNPYEGIITAGGPTAHEYDVSNHWKYCSAIYQQQTGKKAPNAEAVIKLPGGKNDDTYGAINDACQQLSLFHDVAARVGKYLDNENWAAVVSNFGKVDNKGGGPYASLTAGKYDIDDSFRLEKYNSSIGKAGAWDPITPLEDITGQ